MAEHSIVLSKTDIKNMLSELMKQHVVYAPGSNGKKTDYLRVSDVESILMNDELPYKSPKEIFFPRCEKVITFIDGEAALEIPEERAVLFLARPCDLEALNIMKEIFTQGKYKDPFFEGRYNSALIIGAGCAAKKPGCFCGERETDMGYSDKCDLFLIDTGDSYEALYVSEKGRAELGRFIPGLEGFKNTPHEYKPAETIAIKSTEEEFFERIDWKEKAEICQGCGICTYVCPTCHCFVFKDVSEGEKAYRYRNWDSCMFPKSTLHASGHNPRAEKHERYRQRVAHKFLYVNKIFGRTACTGCGRCIRGCPAGMDIKAIAESIAEELK